MVKGTLTGKVFSQRTIDDYTRYGKLYFLKYQKVSTYSLKKELMAIPAASFAKREHYYKAILCLGRFLVQEGALDDGFLEEMKALYPKRHLPPKRITVNEADISTLLDVCETTQERLIVI